MQYTLHLDGMEELNSLRQILGDLLARLMLDPPLTAFKKQ